jgi:hypothetical protein
MKNPRDLGISRRAACRRLLTIAGTAPFAAVCLQNAKPALADEVSSNVTRVEEDWYIKIGTPAPEEDAPQITSVISPGTFLGSYAVFDLNCATQPNFESGGVQLQLWRIDSIHQSKSNTNWDSLHIVDEEIFYTSCMSIENINLVFEIRNGSSETWGTFGTGELKMQYPTWRNHLDHYSPDHSVANSLVGYASHRVRRFELQRVRYYAQNGGLLLEDTTARVLHQYDPQA